MAIRYPRVPLCASAAAASVKKIALSSSDPRTNRTSMRISTQALKGSLLHGACPEHALSLVEGDVLSLVEGRSQRRVLG